MQKWQISAKLAEKKEKTPFFLFICLIFTKNVVTLPKIFGNAD